jgi:hypothetical protein
MTGESKRDGDSTSNEPHPGLSPFRFPSFPSSCSSFSATLATALSIVRRIADTGRAIADLEWAVARPLSTVWERHLEREIRRYHDGCARMPSDPRKRERQLFRIGSAAWGAGLSALMLGDARHSRSWLVRAARDYRASAELASAGAWGRFVGVLKSRVIAGDEGAADDARWTLAADAATAESPTGRYAACLAWLVLGEDADAARLARSLAGVRFPRPVAAALCALAAGASDDFNRAVGEVLHSFETRKRFLEDIRVADTVIALQALADGRNMAARLSSPLLPPTRIRQDE